MSTDVTHPTVTSVLADLTARRISARELLDARVARHEAVHDAVNAVVTVDLDRAHATARQIDDARARGADLGRLAGLPMTVKDSFDVEGMPAVSGNPSFANRPRTCRDADLVAITRAAGAVVWGKTNVPFMLADVQTYNPVYGTTNNPYDTTRTPGGSSGGAAAALATGVTDLEIGSDIGGSLRHPAGFCGVHALKTTWDTLPLRGHVPPGPGTYVPTDLGVVGPMARTAQDLRLLYDVLGHLPESEPRDVRGMRIALWLDEPEFALAGEVRTAVENTAEELRRAGAIVEPAAPPFPGGHLLDVYLALLHPILGAGSLSDDGYDRMVSLRPACRKAIADGAGRYGSEAQILGMTQTYREVAGAQVARQALKDGFAAWLADWDAVLAPISPTPPFAHQQEGDTTERVLDVDGRSVPYLHVLDWTALATALHLPAVALPAGRATGGLPVGAQLIGGWHDEHRLLDLASALEESDGRVSVPARAPSRRRRSG